MSKSIFAKVLTFCLAMTIIFSFNVAAETTSYDIPNTHATIEIPDGIYLFETDMPADHPSWQDAKVLNPQLVLDEANENLSTAILVTNDGKTVIYINRKTSSSIQEHEDYNNLSDEELENIVTGYTYTNEEYEVVSVATLVDFNSNDFIKVDTQALSAYGETVYEVSYFTITADYSLNFNYNSMEPIPTEVTDIIEEVGATITFDPERIPKIDLTQSLTVIILTAILIIFAVAFFIVNHKFAQNKKKENRRITESLANYRKNRPSTKNESTIFSNTTKYTDKAIKTFARYHCFVNKIKLPIISYIFSVLLIMLFILSSADWFFMAVIVAGLGFFTFKLLTSPTKIEKALRRQYQSMSSKTTRYTFTENEFSTVGIENGEYHPYFIIISVRETEDYIYLYYGEQNCYIVDKNNFTKGTLEEFKAYIEKKTGKKFNKLRNK